MPRLSQKQLSEVQQKAIKLAVAGETKRAEGLTRFLNKYLAVHEAQRAVMAQRMAERHRGAKPPHFG